MATTIPDCRRSRSSRRGPLPVVMERLEDRLLLSAATLDLPSLEEAFGRPALLETSGLADIHKLIVAGDPNGSPPDSPTDRVDPNTTDSPFAGVGSLWVDATGFNGYSYIGSATAISPTHVLTAAHMLDLDNNGTIDVAAADVEFILNFGSDLSHMIPASALFVHPDWTGFNSPSVNDDVAVIELSGPLPAGVPIYSLNTDPFEFIETATLVGYGMSGDGVNGYDYDMGAAFDVKRVGGNLTDFYDLDDEGSGALEIFEYDFDWPDGSNGFSSTPGLGNDVETTIGGGDSGGPAFIDDGAGGLELFGINTYTFGYLASAPLFGSGGGGMVVAEYTDWINSVIDDQALGEGFVLSKDGGYTSDDREFATTDTLYMKVWSDSVDFNNLKKGEYKIQDANGQRIQGQLTNNFDGTYTASISLAGLAPGTAKVTLKLEDRSRTKYEVRNEMITIVQAVDTEPPTIPTDLTATGVSSTQIDLAWTASTDNVGVTGYNIFRDEVQVGTSSTVSFSDTGLQPSTTYAYTVAAFDAAGKTSDISDIAIATTLDPDTEVPTTPTDLTATAVSGTRIDLAWTASTDNVGVTGYNIFRGGVQVGTSSTVNFSDTALQPSTTYVYTVVAFDAAGNTSDSSDSASATTLDQEAGEGFALSKNADFSTNDTEFTNLDTLYMMIWSDSVDFNNLKKGEYKIEDANRRKTQGKLTNNFDGTYTAEISLAALAPGTAKINIKIEDTGRTKFEVKDEFINITDPEAASAGRTGRRAGHGSRRRPPRR